MSTKSGYNLVSIHTNWADEMDIDGYVAMTPKDFENWKARIAKIKFPIEIGVGTNEDVQIDKNDFKIKKITEQDYKTLKKLGLAASGHTNCIELEYYRDADGNYADEDEDFEDFDATDEDEDEDEE